LERTFDERFEGSKTIQLLQLPERRSEFAEFAFFDRTSMPLMQINFARSAPKAVRWGRRAESQAPRGGAQLPLAVPLQNGWPVVWAFGFFLLHLPLAFLMRQLPELAGIHALATLVWGLWLCVGNNRSLQLLP